MEFKETWDEIRAEHKLIDELIKIRKEEGLSQSELAERSGNKQQVISRIENKENSPTLKTLCGLLDALGYEIKFELKENVRLKRIKDLNLSVRACVCLNRAGIITVGDLLKITKSDLMKIRNLGRSACEEVISKLNDLGFYLKPDEF